jgi:hypothetical protein
MHVEQEAVSVQVEELKPAQGGEFKVRYRLVQVKY